MWHNRAAGLPFGARFDYIMADSPFFSSLSLRLCLCLRRPCLQVRRKHKNKRMEIVPFSCDCAYACVVASYV